MAHPVLQAQALYRAIFVQGAWLYAKRGHEEAVRDAERYSHYK
jgi:hypothetical protein